MRRSPGRKNTFFHGFHTTCCTVDILRKKSLWARREDALVDTGAAVGHVRIAADIVCWAALHQATVADRTVQACKCKLKVGYQHIRRL